MHAAIPEARNATKKEAVTTHLHYLYTFNRVYNNYIKQNKHIKFNGF